MLYMLYTCMTTYSVLLFLHFMRTFGVWDMGAEMHLGGSLLSFSTWTPATLLYPIVGIVVVYYTLQLQLRIYIGGISTLS